MKNSSVSIVVVTWNTRELTRACIDSILACTDSRDSEIIVVDNASRDETEAMIRTDYPSVKLLLNDVNNLFSEANNQGVTMAKGEYICLLNSDAELREGALSRMVEFLESHPEYGVVGPKLLNPDGSVQRSCRRFYTLLDSVFETTFFGRFPPGSMYRKRAGLGGFDYETSRDMEQIMAACWVVRRSEYVELGGFDTRFSLYFNDHDLCRRYLDRGLKSRYLAEAEVPHLRGKTAHQFNEINLYWNRNRLAYHLHYSGVVGHQFARWLFRFESLTLSLRICLGRQSVANKKQALSVLRSKVKKVLAPEIGS